ncbi:hypothetical protein LS71_008845 [Helicobacter jaachi]|uniref:Uncharacterized protein n=1 Tax=Helicobacter jaachi TaxID=1677920 RepID=A0A4U8T637_9HELI|nr:hypothetical protein [Helicobacter jaachi]TLD94918.1 hypothetical protein LS71_008845 [Helicobacter jaachi]
MNDREFLKRLQSIEDALFSSGFLRQVREYNFSASDLAQIQVQLAQVATQTALSLQELDYKKQQIALEQEKTRQELEMSISRQRMENTKLNSEAIAAAIQAESIKRSVVDNASINKSNALVQYFNVAMNAIANNSANLNAGSTLEHISTKVLGEIEKINTTPLNTDFDEALQDLLDKTLKLKGDIFGNKQVAIIAPKTSLSVGEAVTLLGVSIFGDNECEFINGAEVVKSKFLVFRSEKDGDFPIIFQAKNAKGEWIADNITLKVSAKPTEWIKTNMTKGER